MANSSHRCQRVAQRVVQRVAQRVSQRVVPYYARRPGLAKSERAEKWS